MKQLSLFRGRKQRGFRAPPPLEFAGHALITALLRRWCSPSWIYTHVPLGEYRDKVTAAKLKRMGVMPGWPDFQFAGPAASMFFLELKRRGRGRTSDAQNDVIGHLISRGFDVRVVDSVDIAVSELKLRGILPSKIEVQ